MLLKNIWKNIWKKYLEKPCWQCDKECGETGGDIWKLYQIFLSICKISVRYLIQSQALKKYPEKYLKKYLAKPWWQCDEECGETGGDIWKLYQIRFSPTMSGSS